MPTDTFDYQTPMPASADDVYAWHARPAAFARVMPAWEGIELQSKDGPFGDGHRVTFRVQLLGPVPSTWVAEFHGVEPGRRFADRQTAGPFAEWDHTHTMTPAGPGESVLAEHVEYTPPLGFTGRLVGGGIVCKRLARMFAYRHAVTASDLRRHGLYRDRPRLTVAVTGSRGLVGTDLVNFLTTGGHRVVRLTRGTPKPPPWDDGTTSASWDPEKPVDPSTLDGVDAVIHLAGENLVAGRWTEARKRAIRDSRVGPTRRLAEAAAAAARPPKVFVCASAIGYYGDRGDEELDETSAAGTGFLADVCREWEAATGPAGRAGVRVANVRFGVVLSPKGGALGKQLPAFRAGAGAVLGSGRQWVSWVTAHDLVGAVHHALMTDTVAGPVNVTAPHPVTNRDFGRTLATVLGRPYLLTVPIAALRVMFGEMADEALLASTKVRPRKLTESGFIFDHPDLETGLRFLLGKPTVT